MRVLAIVPAFNEARSLSAVVEGLIRTGLCDVCVIDDGSVDATRAVARHAGALVLSCPVNLGIGGAVQTGYLGARDDDYDVAVQVDGDGQHDPAFLPTLLAPVRENRADLSVGSRFLGEGGFRSSALRRGGIRYLSWFQRVRSHGTSSIDAARTMYYVVKVSLALVLLPHRERFTAFDDVVDT
ncbi:MAG: hypothetical protein A2V77_06825 [Anaeromyxobacter sp. RBG_16_69_14]|nr:MAG: hypothetical protein A2V77_06825 [Anaeromyxobacter sp. RBG_16_69_14]